MKMLAVLLFALLALAIGCSDDPTAPPPEEQTQTFLPLTSRNAVLNNLELGWTQRRPDKIDELMDENFTFHFAPSDVGGEIPALWVREDDLAATTAFLESNTTPPPSGPVCNSVRVDLVFDDSLEWFEVPVPGTAIGEVWYTATVFYSFTFEMEPNTTYIAPSGARAKFTVLQDEAGWRLVEWRDLDSGIAAPSDAAIRGSQVPSWGGVKSLYSAATGFEPLTSREAVLTNLESAWNKRRADKIDEVLDANFAFFFAPGDVGGSIPSQWDRASEYATTEALFTSNVVPNPSVPVCTSTHVDIVFDPHTLTWVEIIPEDFPSEIWYLATVFYSFTFEMDPDVTYIASPDSKAQFTARNAGTEEVPHWQLVEWRDLDSSVTSSDRSVAGATTTWGSIKALYM